LSTQQRSNKTSNTKATARGGFRRLTNGSSIDRQGDDLEDLNHRLRHVREKNLTQERPYAFPVDADRQSVAPSRSSSTCSRSRTPRSCWRWGKDADLPTADDVRGILPREEVYGPRTHRQMMMRRR
jgi:hypothetical protein